MTYRSFTRRNKAEDVRPCATIMIIAPLIPIELRVNKAVSTKPIWATEE